MQETLPNQSVACTKYDLNSYLKELSKKYKRLGGHKSLIDIILIIVDAAILNNYGFREMTSDVDTIAVST